MHSRLSITTLVRATAGVAAGLILATAGTAAATPVFSFDRVGGENRYETSALVAERYGDTSTAILVNGSVGKDGDGNYADALSASYLAGALDAPILLTKRVSTPQVVLDRLATGGVDTVVIVGGTGVVSAAQAAALSADYTVTRVAGSNRFTTNAQVIGMGADAADGLGLVATGLDFPDALAAGPVAYQGHPLALARAHDIDDAVVAALVADNVTEVLVFGGTTVVGQDVVDELSAAGITVRERFAGDNRSATSAQAATWLVDNLGFSAAGVNVASGYPDGFGADALAGGPLTGQGGGLLPGQPARPLLITTNVDKPGDDVLVWLDGHATTLLEGLIFGGPGAVSASAGTAMEEAAQGLGLPDPGLPLPEICLPAPGLPLPEICLPDPGLRTVG